MGTAQVRGQQGRQYDQATLEERLRSALLELLHGPESFADLSVARIIDVAGVARSTFYSYYEDKHAMVLALGLASLERLYDSQRGWIRRGARASREDVIAGMRALLADFREDEAILAAVIQAAALDPRVRAAYTAGVERYAASLEWMFAKDAAAGRPVPAHPHETARTLAWTCERTVTMLAPGAGPSELDRIAVALADVMLAAVGA